MIDKSDLILKYLNVPYKHKGNDLDGLDCWTFPVNWFKDSGYDISFMNPKYDKNYKWNDIKNFMVEFSDRWEKVKVPRYMDIVLFDGLTQHCGVCMDEYRLMHATKKGVKITRISDGILNKTILGYYRLKEIINDNRKI